MIGMIGLIMAILAFVLFGLTNDDHHRRFMGARPDKQRKKTLKYMASLVLAASFPVPCLIWGWVFGPVIWTGEVMLAAAIVFLSFNFMPNSKKG